MSLVKEVKKKKEFSGLPDSVVLRALEKSGSEVKETRKWLRKYFGVFLTNKVLRGKGDLLEVHASSKKRDYKEFYSRIFEEIGDVKSVLDLGCGVNGFSYEFLPGSPKYFGVEAAGQLVDLVNEYFLDKGIDGEAVCHDLFDLDYVSGVLNKVKFDVVFLFQVVDALENTQKDFSKKLISLVLNKARFLVVSLPLVSLGGRKRFAVSRKWLVGWLDSEFKILKDFEMFGERVLIVSRK